MNIASFVATFWLVASSQNVDFVSSVYVDEPLLYDKFPTGVI